MQIFFQHLLLPHGNMLVPSPHVDSPLIPQPLPQATLTAKYIWGLIMPKPLHTVAFETVALTQVMGAEGYLLICCLLFVTVQTQNAARDTQRRKKNCVLQDTIISAQVVEDWQVP